jgi:hypothetical protein
VKKETVMDKVKAYEIVVFGAKAQEIFNHAGQISSKENK